MTKKEETINTYNKSAEALAKKFDAIGPRKNDIEKIFGLSNKENPFVVEIGCGNGRDAEVICTHTNNYLGIDISDKLLELARINSPTATFLQTDIEYYTFPKDIDIIFAFASLIHVPLESFINILANTHEVLNRDGLVFLSLKYSPTYREVIKEDEFGTRIYWHYSEKEIEKLENIFIIMEKKLETLSNQIWMDVILKKR